MNARHHLLEWLSLYAYQYRPEDPFVLASGALSDDYLDCKLALSHPEALYYLGKVLLHHLRLDILAVGGLTMGADPLAMAASFASVESSHPKRWFSVRKGAKEHGAKRLIEGDIHEGEVVAIVDDVCTSGGSTVAAIEACRGAGLVVRQAIVLVDREQAHGMENILQAMGPDGEVTSIFKKSEIRQRWQEINGPTGRTF